MQVNPPVCICRNQGELYDLNGVMVISRDPACRVHVTTLSFTHTQISAETIMGNWKGKEQEDERGG